MRVIALVLAASSTIAGALVVQSQNDEGFLGRRAGMQPDVVAKMMAGVENTWREQAHAFTDCEKTGEDINCKEAPKDFLSSCKKVGSVMFVASSGNHNNVIEYMNDVCSNTHGWHHSACLTTRDVMTAGMSNDDRENREVFEKRTTNACDALWTYFVDMEVSRNKKDAEQVETSMAAKQAMAKAVEEQQEAVKEAAEKSKAEVQEGAKKATEDAQAKPAEGKKEEKTPTSGLADLFYAGAAEHKAEGKKEEPKAKSDPADVLSAGAAEHKAKAKASSELADFASAVGKFKKSIER